MQTHRGKMLKDFLIYLLPVHNRGNYQKKKIKRYTVFFTWCLKAIRVSHDCEKLMLPIANQYMLRSQWNKPKSLRSSLRAQGSTP